MTMKWTGALVLTGCLAASALAETPSAPAAPCPAPGEVGQRHLLGLWRATFDGLEQGATLLLESHPELAESVRGAINRNGERALVAGDVDDGEFTLEESINGTNISATWSGDVVAGSCGREIRGSWQAAGSGPALAFVLRRH